MPEPIPMVELAQSDALARICADTRLEVARRQDSVSLAALESLTNDGSDIGMRTAHIDTDVGIAVRIGRAMLGLNDQVFASP